MYNAWSSIAGGVPAKAASFLMDFSPIVILIGGFFFFVLVAYFLRGFTR